MIFDFKRDEAGRLLALDRLSILDTLEEEPFEEIISLVQKTLDVPMCAVSLIDAHRQWFKASCGLDVREAPRDISFCTHTICSEEPFVVKDAIRDPRFAENPLVTGAPHIRSYCGVPLRMPDGYNVGSLCAIGDKTRAFSQTDIEVLSSFARLVVEKIELRQIASTDVLTGALSRRAWLERASIELERTTRYGGSLSVVVVDIDHFKTINDTHGHTSGDLVLKHLTKTFLSRKRQVDLFGRFGGEEFVVLLPETSAIGAVEFTDRLRSEIANQVYYIPSPVSISFSAGVADISMGASSLDELLVAADYALYQAKEAGRNQVKISKGACEGDRPMIVA